jgi:hypothetical protein
VASAWSVKRTFHPQPPHVRRYRDVLTVRDRIAVQSKRMCDRRLRSGVCNMKQRLALESNAGEEIPEEIREAVLPLLKPYLRLE